MSKPLKITPAMQEVLQQIAVGKLPYNLSEVSGAWIALCKFRGLIERRADRFDLTRAGRAALRETLAELTERARDYGHATSSTFKTEREAREYLDKLTTPAAPTASPDRQSNARPDNQ